MTSDLKALKERLEEDPDARIFSGVDLLPVKEVNGEVHDAVCLEADMAVMPTLTLGEVLELDFSHRCLEGICYKLRGGVGGIHVLSKFFSLVDKLPTLEEFLSTPLPWKSVSPFLSLFYTYFFTGLNGGIPGVRRAEILDYLSLKKGYPADTKEILDIFTEQAVKVCTQFIPSHFKETPSSRENSAGRMIISTTGEFSIYETLVSSGASPSSVMARLALEAHRVPGTSLISAPLHLSGLTQKRYNTNCGPSLEVDVAPSAETLLTVETLIGGGMSLEEAWYAASKL